MASRECSFHDIRDSISLSSTEAYDKLCMPCLTSGQYEEAHGFCTNCQKYLCKNCFTCHQSAKDYKNHRLLQNGDVNEYDFPCPTHKNKEIKFFCNQHDELCCTECLVQLHSTCDIDYISVKCSGMVVSDEYTDTMKKLEQSLSETDDVINKATVSAEKTDACHESVIEEIAIVRRDLNDLFDQQQNEILRQADIRRYTDKNKIETVLETCKIVSSDIKTAMSNLQDIKATGKDRQLFFAIKEANKNLKSSEVKKAEKVLESTNIQYTFKCNKDLQKILSKSEVLGRLWSSSDALAFLGNIPVNVRVESDKETCCITGCAVLAPNKLALADMKNKKLKVLDTQHHHLETEKTLHFEPIDLTPLPDNQIAVTLSEKRGIIIKSSTGRMSTIHKIPLHEICKGITYCQDHLYVICHEPPRVLILDKNGKSEKEISLCEETFSNPQNILISKDFKSIYISNNGNKSIVRITPDGEILAMYQHEDLDRPMGMTMLHDGSFLVCCYRTVHHISGDLKHGQAVIEGLVETKSICFNEFDCNVYVTSWCNDELRTFNLK